MKAWVLYLFVLLLTGVRGFADERIPTEFTAAYLPLEQLEGKLAEAGLEVIGKHAVNGDEKRVAVIYTSKDLRKLGAEPGRGFVSVLRILHNSDKKQLVASNPEYYIRAYFQKDYTDGAATSTRGALEKALGALTPTEDGLTAKKLAKYNFMMGMPHYDDFVRVAKGSTKDLAKQLEKNAGDRVVFSLDIKADGSSMLYGVSLPNDLEGFNDTLGTMDRSQLLPYTVLIENGEANILPAKYYLALCFPELSMGEFMKIRSVPGDVKKAFQADLK